MAAADDFADFRIPANRALLWNAGFSSHANRNDFDQPGSTGTSGLLNGAVNTRVQWFSDSDPAFTSLDVSLAAQGTRFHETSDALMGTPISSALQTFDTSIREAGESWTINASHRQYPWAAPLGIEAALGLSGNYAQNWGSGVSQGIILSPGSSFQTTAENNSELWTYDYAVSATASVGWGRVRNATGIYDAVVLEHRLRETGALMRPLSHEGRKRLAEVLYLRGSLDAVRERPGRALWREIERVLAEDGALREGGLDPYSVLRAAEPHLGASGPLTADGVPISPVARVSGYFAGLRVVDGHTNHISRLDQGGSYETITNGVSSGGTFSSSYRTTYHSDAVYGGPAGEIHLPIGPPWQLDGTADVELGLRKEDNQLIGATDLRLSWLVADRWTAGGTVHYTWNDDERTEGPTPGDQWLWNAGLNVSWYVEDHTAIQLSASEQESWYRGDPSVPSGSPGGHSYSRGLAASFGVTYRFSGWFAAPGYFPVSTANLPSSPAQP